MISYFLKRVCNTYAASDAIPLRNADGEKFARVGDNVPASCLGDGMLNENRLQIMHTVNTDSMTCRKFIMNRQMFHK